MARTGRQALAGARRVVVKIGTGALTNATGRFNRAHFEALTEDLLWVAKDRELVVVSSGAIALGVERLKLAARPSDIPGKQACAAVGQSRLMQAYEGVFSRAGRAVAQVLLTHDDVQDRRRYLNAKHASAPRRTATPGASYASFTRASKRSSPSFCCGRFPASPPRSAWVHSPWPR
jgi:glutamate 5-kinase